MKKEKSGVQQIQKQDTKIKENNGLLYKRLVISIVIITMAIVIDYFVQDYIYKIKYEMIEDDYTHVFQIDTAKQHDGKLVLTGFVFKLEKDSEEDDFEIILYDYNNDKEYYMNVKDVVREDVNEYFLCEYDYSDSGFVASLRLSKLDLENINYEVLIRPYDVKKAYKTGTYISKGELMYAKPEGFTALDVEGTGLEDIVNNGVLRVYRPDVGMYVYQYEKSLYWIANDSYEFEEDESTYVQYQLYTTQTDKLPQHRLDNEWYWDNIGFDFESNEVTDIDTGKYRVTVSKLPTEYSVTKILTGYHVDDWKWKQYFRPWYGFE